MEYIPAGLFARNFAALIDPTANTSLLAAECVIELKKTYDAVRLVLYLPCHHPGTYWSDEDLIRSHRMMGMADEIRFVREEYTPECLKERNEMLVQNAEYGIAFLLTGRSGTGQTLAYAKKRGRQIVNLATRID